MSSEREATDGGYVHRPDGWDDEGTRRDGDDAAAGRAGTEPRRSDDGLGRAGWALVAVVVLAFLVVPGVIYLRPATPGEMGFGFLTAMLVLPMVPAALLGATAVWSAVAGRED